MRLKKFSKNLLMKSATAVIHIFRFDLSAKPIKLLIVTFKTACNALQIHNSIDEKSKILLKVLSTHLSDQTTNDRYGTFVSSRSLSIDV